MLQKITKDSDLNAIQNTFGLTNARFVMVDCRAINKRRYWVIADLVNLELLLVLRTLRPSWSYYLPRRVKKKTSRQTLERYWSPKRIKAYQLLHGTDSLPPSLVEDRDQRVPISGRVEDLERPETPQHASEDPEQHGAPLWQVFADEEEKGVTEPLEIGTHTGPSIISDLFEK